MSSNVPDSRAVPEDRARRFIGVAIHAGHPYSSKFEHQSPIHCFEPLMQKPKDIETPCQGQIIVLVGLMGAGKSCVGRRIAQQLDIPFVDADAEVEEAAGCSIADIFERYGEEEFRDGERRVIARLLEGPPSVLATGGGAFIDPQTRDLIKKNAVSVWLRADLDTLVDRTSGRSHRPLLNGGNPRDVLSNLMDVRYPIYAEADVTVDTGPDSANVTCGRVINALLELKKCQIETVRQ